MKTFYNILMITSLVFSSFALAGDEIGGGGKIIGLITNDHKVLLNKDISDLALGSSNEAISIDLQSGERIYADEIQSILLKKSDDSIFTRMITGHDLNRIFMSASGGDGGGGGR